MTQTGNHRPINQPPTTKGTAMSRSITAPILALSIATTTLTGTVPALAAAHDRTPARETQRSQAGLITSVTNFGYALISRKHVRIDPYATRPLLAGAPARHALNLLPPAQRSPSSFAFRITRFSGSTGAATMQLKQGASVGTARTLWTYTGAGWKLSALGQNGAIPAGLELARYAPVNGKVSAQMIGKSFVPNEQVQVTYKVKVRNVFTRQFQATATADKFGAFLLSVKFDLGNSSYGYAITATAVGEMGDRATLNTLASGQTR